jgi:hypothetical protein
LLKELNMAGQSNYQQTGSFPSQAQMPQQTIDMLSNRFGNFEPMGISPPQIPQMGQMPMLPPSPLMQGQIPNQMAFQNANSMANLAARFPLTQMPSMGQMPQMGGMPNQMAFQNANPAAGLDARFPMTQVPQMGMPNQMAFDSANQAANLMGRFQPSEVSTMPARMQGQRGY